MTRLPARDTVLLLLVCLALPPLTAHGMPKLFPQSLALTLSIAAALAVAAVSLNLLLGYAGQISLGHAALLGVGAFAASLVVDRLGLTMLLGWVAAIAAGAATAFLLGAPALRLRGLYLAVVTMSFGLAMQASVLRWRFFTQGSAGAALPRRWWGDRLLSDESVYLSLCLLLLVSVCVLDRNVLHSKVGRAFRMLKEDEDAALSFGIDVTRYKLTAFVLSGGLAGLAGALYGHSVRLVNSDTFALSLSLRILLLVILGGLGRRNAVVLFAIIFALAPELPEALARYELVAVAAAVLYTAVRLPGGLAELGDRFRSSKHPDQQLDDDEPTLPRLTIPSATTRGPSSGTLEVMDIEVSFGSLRVLEGVSLRVPAGQIVGIIGPNGAGKSTLFNAISGLVPGASGQVLLDGRRIDTAQPHERAAAGLGRTFQDVGLGRDMSIRENVLLAQHITSGYSDLSALLRSASYRKGERRLSDIADEVVAGLGFADRSAERVGQLSGGQRRLVELAAVLATSPRVLMLDEPTAGLAPAAAEDLAARLAELRSDYGQTIVLIEHNVPLVLDLCDYVYVLSGGRVLAEGAPAELGRDRSVLDAYLGGALL